MLVDDLYEMKVKDLLEEFCLVYSPECDYHYGIARWDDVGEIWEEYDLDEQYCFEGDYLIPMDYGFDEGESVLTLKDLKCIMDKLGIVKKQSCPECDSENYHFDYNHMAMLCSECGHIEEPKTEEY